MRAICVPQEAPEPLQKELGPLGTGTRRTMRDKLNVLVCLLPFFACNASSCKMKTPALPTERCRRVVLCQRGGHI